MRKRLVYHPHTPTPTLQDRAGSLHWESQRGGQEWVGPLGPEEGAHPLPTGHAGHTRPPANELSTKHRHVRKGRDHTNILLAVSHSHPWRPLEITNKIWRQNLGQDTSQINHFYLQVKHAAKKNPYSNSKGGKLQIKSSSRLVGRAGADQGARTPMHPTHFPANITESCDSHSIQPSLPEGLQRTQQEVTPSLISSFYFPNTKSGLKIMSGLETWPRRKANTIIKPLTQIQYPNICSVPRESHQRIICEN